MRKERQTTPITASKKKLPTCKPDPVPASLRAVIIYLAPALLQGSSCLPSGVASLRMLRTSRPRPPVYVAFQHARFTRAAGYPTTPWALTPRFHPHLSRGSYFLWHLLWMLSHPPALNRYIALCCPDFPPPARQRAMTRLVAAAKIRIYPLGGFAGRDNLDCGDRKRCVAKREKS